MSAAETGQMSAAGTRQMCALAAEDTCPVSAADVCPVSTAKEDIYPVLTEDKTAAGRRPAAVMSSVEAG